MAGKEKNFERSFFIDKTHIPADEELAIALGGTSKFWDNIKVHIAEKYGATVQEWKIYGIKHEWALKTLLKKRNLFFLGPRDGFFIITFVFGDKAVDTVKESDFPKELIDDLVNSKKYMEGRVLRIEVMKKKDVENVIKLIDIKVKN